MTTCDCEAECQAKSQALSKLERMRASLVLRYQHQTCIGEVGVGQTCVRNQSVYCHVCHIQTMLELPTRPAATDPNLAARHARNDAWAALADIIRRCGNGCTRASYCGACEVALRTLPEGYDLDHTRPCTTHGCTEYEVHAGLCEACLEMHEIVQGTVAKYTPRGR